MNDDLRCRIYNWVQARTEDVSLFIWRARYIVKRLRGRR